MPLDLKSQLLQLPRPLRVLVLQFASPVLNPLRRIRPPVHLRQTLAPPPPRLAVGLPLQLDGASGVGGAFGPLRGGHVGLGAVGVERGGFFAQEAGRFEGWAREGYG